MAKKKNSLGKGIRKYTSPTFLAMLVIATLLWYVKKLSYTYTTEIPVTVSVIGQQFKVGCMAEGSGYNLFAYKHLLSTKVQLGEDALEAVPGSPDKSAYMVNSFALQNAISMKLDGLRIISVAEPPDIVAAEPTIQPE